MFSLFYFLQFCIKPKIYKMKPKFILIALLFLSVKSQAQLLDKIDLKDYEVLTNDVIKITNKSFDYDKTANTFKNPDKEIINFDSKGYKIDFSLNDNPKFSQKFTYDANHKKVTQLYLDNKAKYDFIIEKVPFGNVLMSINKYEIPKNPDGSIKKITYLDKEKNLDYNYSYNGSIITVTPNSASLNTTRATKDGLLLSEENEFINAYFSYDTKTKLLSQKISIMKNIQANVHYIFVYEYDKKGNWIVKYEVTAVPLYGTKGNAIKTISVRELIYKDNTKTGYTTISDDMKTKGFKIPINLNVKMMNADNRYDYPIYMDFDTNFASNITASNTLDPKCEGDCLNGWGKYTYDNGYYDGFWENGQKSGYGIYKWTNGDLYLGHWYQNKMSGFGQTLFANGNEYAGGYSNGKYDGYAIYFNKANDKNEYNKYADGKYASSNSMNNNGVSTGCTHGNCNNGYGRFVFNNGGIYIGQFIENGLYMGVYYFPNGDVYQGTFNFKTNKFSGYGYYQYKESGDFYKGIWADGKQGGKGLSYTKGKYYKDEWKDDKVVKSF